MEYVEQSHSLMNTLELWAKKVTERCSEEACDRVVNEVKQLHTEWESMQSRVAEAKLQLESHRMQLADYDDALKRELAWMQDVERYFADAVELPADLADKKSRLQRTKVRNFCFKLQVLIVWSVIILMCKGTVECCVIFHI